MVADAFDTVTHPGIYFNKYVLNENNIFTRQILIARLLKMVRN